MKTYIRIKTSFEAIHYWPTCPIESVSFLKNLHRHIFFLEARAPVNHNDRDIEFIFLKRNINSFIEKEFNGKNIGSLSCEMLCEQILIAFPQLDYISILEDNENGAEVFK